MPTRGHGDQLDVVGVLGRRLHGVAANDLQFGALAQVPVAGHVEADVVDGVAASVSVSISSVHRCPPFSAAARRVALAEAVIAARAHAALEGQLVGGAGQHAAAEDVVIGRVVEASLSCWPYWPVSSSEVLSVRR
jgi:hypothetical protein